MAAKVRPKKKTEAVTPVYFLSLTVENVRCFGPRQTLNLSDGKGRPAQWTILLGENGVGKTTLLQCLAVFSPLEDPLSSSKSRQGFSSRYVTSYKLRSEWKPQRYSDGEPYFNLYGVMTEGVKISDIKSQPGHYPWSLSATTKEVSSEQMDFEGFCLGYGAARRMGEGAISKVVGSDPTASLFSENVALLNAEEWLLQTDYTARIVSPIQKRTRQRLEQIRSLLIKLLPDVEDIRFPAPTETQTKPRVEFETPYGWVSIKDLGLGYKTLITWMVDFAARMFERYPNSANPLAEPAIVLVDEIDLHLHPRWQRELISHLTNLFPNTQFIATAHSPLVVQAATDANIVLLRRDGDHVVIDNDIHSVRGWRIDQIYTSDLFGLESSRPPHLDKAIKERNKILSKGRLTKKDRERLRQLEAEIGLLPYGETPADIEAMDIIRRAAEHLKQQAPHDSDQ